MVNFRLLGEFAVEADGRPVDVGPSRQRAVLVVLVLEVNRTVSPDLLADRVWGEHQPRRPKDAIYSYLSRLRTALSDVDGVAIRRSGGGYLLAADPMTVDVYRFRHLVRQAGTAEDDRDALALLDEAVGLWWGRPLAGLDLAWLSALRAELDRERLAAELDRNDIRLRAGRHAQVVAELPAAEAERNERLAGQLMLALYRCGRPADALRHYERVRSRLAEELGVDPGPQLRHLHQQILTSDPELAADEPTSRPAEPTVPRQLPTVPASFSGRVAELAALDGLLASSGSPIYAVVGAGGMGKTWLALRWAHDNADRFPDGQLYVHLRGFDPHAAPVPPATAVRGFLDALGVPPAAIPADFDPQAALYRSLTAHRRMLIVLDDARDTAQVTPLLPGGGSCAVLITSRSQLPSLVSGHGARSLPLRLLTEDDARDLLRSRLGTRQVDAEPGAVLEIVRACAGLPLALGIVVARAATQLDLPLTALAAELRDSEARLDALDSGELPANLRVVFSTSYTALDPATARAFRLLGLAPGPDIDIPAAANLLEAPIAATQALLRRLTTTHLLQAHRPGWYRLHDLVRLYAGELTRATDDRAALTRLFDYYVYAASVVMDCFTPQERYRRPAVGAPVPHAPTLNDRPARDWLDAQRPMLLAVAAYAATHGWPDHTRRLSSILFRYLDVDAHYHDALALHTSAVTVTAPDPLAHGHALYLRGHTLARLGRDAEAHDHHERALRSARTHHDHVLEIHAATGVAYALDRQGDQDGAIQHFEYALALARRSGHNYSTAVVLNNFGECHRDRGRHAAAVDCLRQSLAIAHDLHDAGLIAHVLYGLGQVYGSLEQHDTAVDHLHRALKLTHSGHNRTLATQIHTELGRSALATHAPSRALSHFRDALTIAREIGAQLQQAHAHHGLAQAHQHVDQPIQARQHLEQALTLYTELNAPEAAAIRQHLTADT
ncbi:hypothetical protein ALI144C_06520 [Actinosynnema sp. ALI-1.44]|uniref:AfsR/SARP family transcriptional regulator n=1 Tax=Actinosynnema sp. ALI-1.44 TaxID=1933779 RepID=UPI00097C35B5|nr:tetratricopeptide repeat protein [Actinosynnema sp. ALI-1.44]ONI88673.1 hypothetical protein ALI144C_06520 [Actinosynnema sp. ALI-1.44]